MSEPGQRRWWPRRWWLRRTVPARITLVVTACTVLFLVVLARFSGQLLGTLLVDAADTQLRPVLTAAAGATQAGRAAPGPGGGVQVAVLDRAGDVIGPGARPGFTAAELDALQSGEPVLSTGDQPPQRWLGVVVTAPDGSQRLVVAGATLIGYDQARTLALRWMLVAAALGGAAAGMGTWLAVRGSLRPVQRMRIAAGALPPGRRLPVPEARDELRALAEAMNALLVRRDEARARLQRFTGDAAHELRSPVASIRTQAEVAVLHPDPELSVEVLADVVAEAERLSKLIDDLLVLSRSDAGELPAAGSVDLALAASAAIDRLPAAGPRVRLQAPTQTCAVWSTTGEVDLVLDNLLRNAVRYASARITVFVLPSGGGGRLVVDDDGPGVPAEHRARVFDRFYRVQDDRGRRTGGSGLGLALVAEVVQRRGGAVSVGESPDGGARFEVRWPGRAR